MSQLQLQGLEAIIQRGMDVATEAGVYLILRIQEVRGTGVRVVRGKTEGVSDNKTAGMGAQVFTSGGQIGFAATDEISLSSVGPLVRRAAALAHQAQSRKAQSNQEIFNMQPTHNQINPSLPYPLDTLTLPQLEEAVLGLNREVESWDERLAVTTLFSVTQEEWRIARSDGTDVHFLIPRSVVMHQINAKDGAAVTSVSAALPGRDLDVLLDLEATSKLRRRAQRAASLAVDLLHAPKIAPGPYRLVIDYALAKGLAHEAFGHAVESDQTQTSILADGGRFRLGEKVAPEYVSIIDGPIEGDYAYQPISANGIPRQTVEIVGGGRLRAGLGDVFSARQAGIPVSGAGRAQSYRHLPLPRMSNIRIQVTDPLPLDKPWEDVSPEDLKQILDQAGLLDQPVLYLTGYRGGQVNPAKGDFVFNCTAIYRLDGEIQLFKPAIFSGSILSALRSIHTGIGPLILDALGTCGKQGQGVPSSGGSHAFLILDADPDVRLGGGG